MAIQDLSVLVVSDVTYLLKSFMKFLIGEIIIESRESLSILNHTHDDCQP